MAEEVKYYDAAGNEVDPYAENIYNPTADQLGETEPSVNLTEFQALLNRLEGSKKRQQRQKSVEGRRDIYAQGLASMMSNF